MLNSLAALYGNGVAASTTAYESIATVTIGSGGSSTITFSSIPQTYSHLQIRAISRSNASGSDDYYKIRFNGDSGSNYRYDHYVGGDGSSVFAGTDGAGTFNILNYGAGSTSGSNVYGVFVYDILDYTSTNKNKTGRALAGLDRNGSGSLALFSTLWYATPAAITSMTIEVGAGTLFSQYSQFALYGVK